MTVRPRSDFANLLRQSIILNLIPPPRLRLSQFPSQPLDILFGPLSFRFDPRNTLFVRCRILFRCIVDGSSFAFVELKVDGIEGCCVT